MYFLKARNYLTQLYSLKNLDKTHWLVLFGSFILLHMPAIVQASLNLNLSVMLADAFLHGHLDVKSFLWDASEFEGKYFSPFPPFPAVLAMPFVAIFGASHVNAVILSVVLSCANIYIIVKLMDRFDVPTEYRFWILLGYLLGTGYWFTVIISHHVGGYAHVVSTTLLLWSLLELFGKQRVWLLAVLVGCSFLTRQMTLFHSIFIVFYFFFYTEGNTRYKKIVAYGLCLLPFVGIYLVYNYFRFHNPLDTGYSYLSYIEMYRIRIAEHGLFSVHHIPYNAYHLFIKGPNIVFQDTDLRHVADMDFFGTSLTLASPFVIAAFKSSQDAKMKWGLWLSIVVIMLGGLMYFNNGFEQINTQRFTLDFMPLLLVLICYGCTAIPVWLFRGLVLYSVFLNIFSFVIHYLYQ